METSKSFRVLLIIAVILLFGKNGMAIYLDPEFGSNGHAVVELESGAAKANSLVVQDDGRILTVGTAFTTDSQQLVVSRFLPDGQIDTSFGVDGLFTFEGGIGGSTGTDILLQDDGKIIVSGLIREETSDLFLLRINQDGSLDTPFGAGGRYVLDLPGSDELAAGVKQDENGSLLLAGTSIEGSSRTATVVRVDAAGVLDTSYGDSGYANGPDAQDVAVNGIDLDESGSVIVAGSLRESDQQKPLMYKIGPDGFLDQEFGSAGVLTFEGGETQSAEFVDVKTLTGEHLVAVGYTSDGDLKKPILAWLDDRYSGEGSHLYKFPETGDSQDLAVHSVDGLSDGSLVIVGSVGNVEGKDLLVMRLNTASFATDDTGDGGENGFYPLSGFAAIDESEPDGETQDPQIIHSSELLISDVGGTDESLSVTVLPEGEILTAGYSETENRSDIALTQYAAESFQFSSDEVSGTPFSGAAYYVTTLQASQVTRTTAASGGSISYRVTPGVCQATCEFECSFAADDYDTCYEECYSACLPATTVTHRGVCYSVVPHPVYRVDDDTDDSDSDNGASAGSDGGGLKDVLFPEDNFYYGYITRQGQTSDGSGDGVFGSDIIDLTPDTLYYARSYAVLSDGTVIYGNEISFKTSDACFIATAAYGSFMQEDIRLLRMFRDKYLESSAVGRYLIGVYYHFSPELADIISNNELLRGLTRILLLPVVFICFLLLNYSPALLVLGVAVLGLSFLILKKYLFYRKSYETCG